MQRTSKNLLLLLLKIKHLILLIYWKIKSVTAKQKTVTPGKKTVTGDGRRNRFLITGNRLVTDLNIKINNNIIGLCHGNRSNTFFTLPYIFLVQGDAELWR